MINKIQRSIDLALAGRLALERDPDYCLRVGRQLVEDANDWNRDTPMAKVVVTEAGQPYVSMDIGVAADGIGRKNFEDALATWNSGDGAKIKQELLEAKS